MEKVKGYKKGEEMQKAEVAMTGSSSKSRIFEALPTKRVLY